MYRSYKVYVRSRTNDTEQKHDKDNNGKMSKQDFKNAFKDVISPPTHESKATTPQELSNGIPHPPAPPPPPLVPKQPKAQTSNHASGTATQNAGINKEKKSKFVEEQRESLGALKNQADDMIKQIEGLMAKLAPSVKPLDKKTLLLSGNLETEYPVNSKVVRIFTSSTFTDTMQERNALMERVYPRLKQHCKARGYDFQVVDMRWGVRDEATNDHMTTELCLKEIEACKKLSTGPSFVTFLSHKYGYRPLQRVIEEQEFSTLLTAVTGEEDKALLEKWYKLDNNAVPPSRVLQPISTYIPDYLLIKDRNHEKFKNANKEWWETFKRISEMLSSAAMATLPEDRIKQYVMSVTEKEVREGLLANEHKDKSCMWFHRTIRDIDEQEPTRLVSKYKDIGKNEPAAGSSQSLLLSLKETVSKALPSESIISHDVAWTEKGVDPETSEEHKQYIDALCVEFESSMKESIDKAIEEQSQNFLSEKTCEEVSQHLHFCKEKCAAFHGRKDVLEKIKTELVGPGRHPYVIHGSSGCGKTSLMATVASSMKKWLCRDNVLVLRFLGTTPESSNLRQLLRSVLDQICKAYREKPHPQLETMELRLLMAYFHLSLRRISKNPLAKVKPLLIVLDSLDQLSNEGNPQGLSWIPKEMPENTYLIISTLPDTEEHKYGYLPKLQAMFASVVQQRFLDVPEIPVDDAKEIVTSWLEKDKRKLTEEQFTLVIKTFEKCKLPLFLKLCFDEAYKWASFTQVDDSCLADTIQGAISAMFENMERKHGQMLAARTFAYITASQIGLSEIELEDILSCDDDVLNDVYQYWTPPIRRLPPLLFVRLKSDVSQYLVERGSGGVTVIYWYHRQFIETARHRYLTGDHITQAQRRVVHQNIGDYFLEKWAYEKEKPFTTKTGETQSRCRYVTPQPLKMKDQYNLRRLGEMPMHLVLADRFTEFNDNVMLNREFHVAKIKKFTFRALIEDLDFALENMSERHDVTEWTLMRDTLRLSEDAINCDMDLLSSQIFGRISQGLDGYKKQCMEQEGYKLIATTALLTAPGGELKYCLAGHSGDMTQCVMTSDEGYAVTGNEDMTVRVWDIEKGNEKQCISGGLLKSAQYVDELHLCCSDKYIVAIVSLKLKGKTGKCIFVFDIKTGLTVHQKVMPAIEKATRVFDNSTHLALAMTKKILLFDVEQAELSKGLMHAPYIKPHSPVCMSGAKSVLCTAIDDRFLYVYDVDTCTQTYCIEVAPKAEGEDDDDWTPDEVAVTPSGEKVAAISIMDSVLHMFDTKSGQRIATINGCSDDSVNGAYFISETLFVSAEYANNTVMVWDTEINERYHFFKHTEMPEKVCATKDLTRFVTITSESVVRVWESKEDVRIKYKPEVADTNSAGIAGDFQEERIQDLDILLGASRDLDILPGASRYVLMHTTLRFKDEKKEDFACLKIYDVHEDKAVRTVYLSKTLRTVHVVSQSLVLIVDTQSKLHLINMDTMTLVKTYQGFAGSRTIQVGNADSGRDIFCLTKYLMKLKVLDFETGQTKTIINTGVEKPLSTEFVVSADGTRAVVEVDNDDDSYLLAIDVLKQQVIHTLRLKGLDYLSITDAFISKDGRYFLVSVFHNVPDVPNWTATYLPVWDLNDGKLVQYIYDKDHPAVKKCKEEKKTNDQLDGLEVDHTLTFEREDGRISVVTGCSDHSLRAYDAVTGQLVKTISKSHTRSFYGILKGADTSEEKGKYCFSFSSEDHSLYLYNIDDWSTVACFKFDDDVKKMAMLDNYTVVIGQPSETPGVHAKCSVLRLYNGSKTGAPPPHVISTNDTEVNLALPEADKNEPEEGDPDTDVKPPESDIEDSDEEYNEHVDDDEDKDKADGANKKDGH